MTAALSAEDVRKIAAALVKTAVGIESEEDGGGRNVCKLCRASVPWINPGAEIKHNPDCAVALAQAVLASPRLVRARDER